MWNDPIIDEIHKFRDQHASKFDYDMLKILEDFKIQEKESGLTTVSLLPKHIERERLVA
ncbi:MAG: hypothetical protein R8K20_06005 [Gallionellaceae bacterium]